jgi:chromosome partitioning protein
MMTKEDLIQELEKLSHCLSAKEIEELQCEIDTNIDSAINNIFSTKAKKSLYIEYKSASDMPQSKVSILDKIKNNKLPAISLKAGRQKHYIPSNALDIIEQQKAKKEIASKATTIAIGNHKGGVSKTTNSLNIASTLSFFGYKVLLVDIDPQANATKAFGLFADTYNSINENNIIELLTDTISTDEELYDKTKKSIINIQRPYIIGKLDIIPNSPTEIDKSEHLRDITSIDTALDDILEYVRDEYDFIIIDTPPRTGTILNISLMASDYFIVALHPEPFASLGVADIISPVNKIQRAYQKRKNTYLHILGAIVAKVGKSTTHIAQIIQNRETLLELTNHTATIFDTFISQSEKVGESQYGDGAMIFTDFKHKVSLEYIQLTFEIVDKILQNRLQQEL